MFRAYDIRGIYPTEVNIELVKRVTEVLAEKFFDAGAVVVGYDVRTGSEELYKEAVRTLQAHGREVVEAGMITTPMLTFLIHSGHAAGGMMITASHNPKEYNGIKMAGRDGLPIGGAEVERAFEA